MEEFLGVLFCGGRGTRLGEITQYISKSFVPIYDRPVFWFGLNLLEKSRYIDEIVILTNEDNNDKLKNVGYPTVVQDDHVVFDMFSGWEYIKKETGTEKHGVLMPGDNISDINIDQLIELFLQKKVDLVFSLYRVKNLKKLSGMGCYDAIKKEYYYKPKEPPTEFGVIAPYVARNTLRVDCGDQILGHKKVAFREHKGVWYDTGDYDSIIEASDFLKKSKGKL